LASIGGVPSLTGSERRPVLGRGAGALSTLLAVATVALAGFRLGLGVLPHIARQGTARIVAFVEAAAWIPAYIALVALGCDQFPLGHDFSPKHLFKVERLAASEVPEKGASTIMADSRRTQTERGYPAEKARGGEVILHKRWQRVVFIAGLAGAVILGFVLALLGR
jgi:hypothetical protein